MSKDKQPQGNKQVKDLSQSYSKDLENKDNMNPRVKPYYMDPTPDSRFHDEEY